MLQFAVSDTESKLYGTRNILGPDTATLPANKWIQVIIQLICRILTLITGVFRLFVGRQNCI